MDGMRLDAMRGDGEEVYDKRSGKGWISLCIEWTLYGSRETIVLRGLLYCIHVCTVYSWQCKLNFTIVVYNICYPCSEAALSKIIYDNYCTVQK